MADVCPPSSLPVLQTDPSAFTGRTFDIQHLRVYLAAPSPTEEDERKRRNNTKAFIVLYDVHGFDVGRLRGLCDTLALEGYHAIMPDVFHGVGIADIGGFQSERGKVFLQGQTWRKLEEEIDLCIDHLKSLAVDRIAVGGFCWGAWPTFRACATGKVHVGIVCHPSFKAGVTFHGDTVEGLASSVVTPIQINAAGNDPDEFKEGGVIPNAIVKKGLPCSTHTFADMTHGWVARGDVSDPKIREGVEKAMSNITSFLAEHL